MKSKEGLSRSDSWLSFLERGTQRVTFVLRLTPVATDGLNQGILLPPPPQCWDCRQVLTKSGLCDVGDQTQNAVQAP